MATIRVRLFAAAREAAGRSQVEVSAADVGELFDTLTARHPDLGRVLTHCSVLIDGHRTTDRATPLTDGLTVDVLPPYAGG